MYIDVNLIKNEVKQNEAIYNPVIASDAIIFFGGGLISFIIMWTGAILVISKILKIRHEKIIFKKSLENPCDKCQYFSNNYFLRCAVQPAIVGTKEAINCSDFYLKDN
jgi:hypothetical protein